MKVTVPIEIAEQRIADTLGDADISYWGDVSEWDENSALEVVQGKKEIFIIPNEPEDKEYVKRTLSRESILAALPIIAEKWPWHFKDILDETGDATTGDVLIQVAVLDDIVFG